MRLRLPLLAFTVWTLLVWTSRMRNVLADDDLDASGTTWRLAAAGLFVVLAVAALATRRWKPEWSEQALGALVVWTIGWWVVRGVGILLDDHEVGFKVVHTILMVVSIGLAMWAWKARDR